ncbi:MAG: aminotransferase class IV family protein [Bacteroidia bacterium]|nr:aminotransferase class IV family protein [Bacteroidia bacterium]
MYTYIHNEIVPAEKAFLHVRDLSIQRGYGVFDFFKIKDGHPYFLNDYLERFYHSAKVMHLSVPQPPDALKSIICQLIEKNNIAESGIKIILTGGYSEDGYLPSDPNLIITQHSLILPSEEVVNKGVKIITQDYVRDLPTAKTINYSMGIWLAKKIKEELAYDVLYHQNNVVSEFPRCNFFIVRKDDTVVTPIDRVLNGITRKNILKLAANKYNAEEGIITLDDIYHAKEAFLTSTTKRIVPIVEINDTFINNGKPGPISLSLLAGLKALEQQDVRLNKQ